jgi:hypothetical protein
MRRAKVPAGFEDLDLELVSYVLAAHRGAFYPAARELGLTGPELTRLTWAKPELLDEAHKRMRLDIVRANNELIGADCSEDPARRKWAKGRRLAGYIAQGHPLARLLLPARKSRSRGIGRGWRLGRTAAALIEPTESAPDLADRPLPEPAPPSAPVAVPQQPALPIWPGPCPPPPLVADRYSWTPPPQPMIVGGHRETPRPAVLRRRRRV